MHYSFIKGEQRMSIFKKPIDYHQLPREKQIKLELRHLKQEYNSLSLDNKINFSLFFGAAIGLSYDLHSTKAETPSLKIKRHNLLTRIELLENELSYLQNNVFKNGDLLH